MRFRGQSDQLWNPQRDHVTRIDSRGRLCRPTDTSFIITLCGVDSLFARLYPTNPKLLMGIQGLLPFLKSIQNQRHLSELSGQTLAVDSYCWLHRGTYTCSTELATGRKTSK